MRNWNGILLLFLMSTLPALAGEKQKGATTLKDFQPAGTTEKNHKHQQFDFIFDASGTEYTCRSSPGSKLKAIDWPVSTDITYEIKKEKGKVKNKNGKEVDCTIMRVETIKPTAQN